MKWYLKLLGSTLLFLAGYGVYALICKFTPWQFDNQNAYILGLIFTCGHWYEWKGGEDGS
ncbi:hypothetical protein STSP2_03149 [Anaerohalosphaera lusitana]|uniref:Uncharacterized protein n=1 Tax=Anaerohalosphaera lusitana TaxID=1936003 RepID=A0A1U9NPW6_9BACT|nr:hypothetical protein [Anaerohalosphaera lusitana]AQT69949.1 hypothetical protein STSP2_03149 [Anaerohalosphaera lusitana]